ncbi:hypothetical protein HFO38_24285 [Rhizobium leguminosarum]|uniref:hypothetical protein n=1 Tax=Rhizobium leguminosarum TaxID=384 RepID=UPI001C976CFE|nr:hypothetical protein [Rhizobium leguminosarum]MBY5705796.1 hypothetical protein [Rhizobium leguminosarum]
MQYHRWKIKKIGGEEILDRLIHKGIGGKSFADGRDFEIAYTIHVVIVEIERTLKAYLRSDDQSKFDGLGFEEQPEAFVDDLALSSLDGEILVQMKSGSVEWNEVVRDFKIQRRVDRAHKHSVSYRLVNGSENDVEWLRNQLDARGLPSTQAEMFVFSRDFEIYSSANVVIVEALAALTGSRLKAQQKVAFGALLHAFWNANGKSSFVDLQRNASEHIYHYLSRWDEYGLFSHFEASVRRLVPDAEVVVAGRMLHLGDNTVRSGTVRCGAGLARRRR